MQHQFRRLVCSQCGLVLDVPIFCGNRFCPVCSVSRRSRVRDRLDFLSDNAELPKGSRFKFLTLTITSETDLPGMIKSLMLSFRRLRQRSIWKKYVHGGAFVIEVTSNGVMWHAHIHAILVSKFIPYFNLLNAWRAVSNGRGVYLKDIPKSDTVRYLTKYLSKPDVPDELLYAANFALKGTRLFAPFGSWFSLNKKYKKKKFPCENCTGTSWIDLDIMNGDFHHDHWKDFDVGVKRLPAPATRTTAIQDRPTELTLL